jgi:hypothetical protein
MRPDIVCPFLRLLRAPFEALRYGISEVSRAVQRERTWAPPSLAALAHVQVSAYFDDH